MDRQHADLRYFTRTIDDPDSGVAGLQLFRETEDGIEFMASLMLWDAVGEFWFKPFTAAIPLEIVEALIAEAKAAVKTK